MTHPKEAASNMVEDAQPTKQQAVVLSVRSILQCFRVRIRAQISRQDLDLERSPPLSHLVAQLLINTNLLSS